MSRAGPEGATFPRRRCLSRYQAAPKKAAIFNPEGMSMHISRELIGMLFAAALAAATLAHAQDVSNSTSSQPAPPAAAQPGPQNDNREDRMRQRHERMMKELNLSDAQKQQMKSIHQESRQQAEAIRNDSSLTPEQKHAKLEALHDAIHEKVNGILTPEQQEKVKAMKHHRKHGHRKGAGQGEQPPSQ